jgi:D-alanyl-D-alanine carboxypeptidase (penicillin-binding protein 5/6)
MDKPAPPVSALSWVILDRKTKEVLFGRMEKERREVASLTKIMTMYTVLQLTDNLGLSLNNEVTVHESSAEV